MPLLILVLNCIMIDFISDRAGVEVVVEDPLLDHRVDEDVLGWCDLWRLPLGNSFLICPVYWKLLLCDNKLLSLYHSYDNHPIQSHLSMTERSKSKNIAKGTTDPNVEFSLAKVTFLGHINFKISTEHQILMSTDCPDDMLSENIYIITPESIVKKKTNKLHSYSKLFNHIFLLMSRKYASEVNALSQ